MFHPLKRFQYPRLDRRVENESANHRCSDSPRFQYPRLDRRVENFTLSGHGGGLVLFQYPRLDRRVENPNARWTLAAMRRVSVSTTGSKGRKRAAERACKPLVRVSVSTTGSKGRKRWRCPGTRVRRLWFQYPRLDRRVENSADNCQTQERHMFQYPRLDRRVENG